jgi:hypothetical protein
VVVVAVVVVVEVVHTNWARVHRIQLKQHLNRGPNFGSTYRSGVCKNRIDAIER